jgi:hypothetical protein
MNILVITDVSWDNIPAINRRFRKISTDDTIHTIYYDNIEVINRCCVDNFLKIVRHLKKTKQESLSEILHFCDLCIVFHNFIEYNNVSRFVINKCEEYSIPFFIFSENTNDFQCSVYDKIETSFRNCLRKIPLRECKSDINYTDEDIIELKQSKQSEDIDYYKDRLTGKYEECLATRKSINLLYDKDELKNDKESKKAIRQMSKLQFDNNRLSYYKNKETN